jgi:glutathione S-transferase
MKLYLTAGACSLADHIALHEAGLAFDGIRADLRTKRTEDGGDFNAVNPNGSGTKAWPEGRAQTKA